MRVVALKSVPYAGVNYRKGQEFDIEDKHFKVLSFIKKVEKAPVKPVPPKPSPQPKAKAAPRPKSTPAPKAAEKSDSVEEKSTGGYQTRDMKAES